MLARFPVRSIVLLSLGVLAAAPATPDGPASHVLLPPPALAPPEAAPGRFSLGPLLDSELLRDLPLGGDVWSAFETVESTAILNRMASGGMYIGEPGLLGIRGSSATNASWRLGDLDITDPDRPGTPLLLVDPEALEEIVVTAGVMPADQGGAGPAVSLVLRRPGGAAWHRAVRVDTVPTGWQQSYRRNKAPTIASYGSFGSGRFQLDGPLIQDRLDLFVSGTLARGSRRERADPRDLAGRETGLLANLIWKRDSRDEVRFVGAAQGTLRPYAGRARLGGGDVREADRYLQFQSTWFRRGPKPWSVSGGYVRGAFDPRLPTLAGTGVVERLTDGPVQEQFPGDSVRARWALSGWLDPFTDSHHALRVGGSLARSSSSTRPPGSPGLTAETVNGLPARVWDYGWAGPESRSRAFDLAAYADDQITYGRLSVDAGLRFEATHGSGTRSSTIDWDALSPRLLARFRPAPWRGLALLAGYARYRHRLPLSLLGYGDPAAAQGLVYRWLDANGDGVFQPGEQGPLVARIGPGGPNASIDPGLKAPRSRDVFVGCDVRAGVWNVRFLAYHHREFDLVTSVNVGAPLSAYDVSLVPDPGNDIAGTADDQLLPIYNRRPDSFGTDRYLLTNDSDKGQVKGYELAISGLIGKRMRLLVGGTNSISMSPAGYRGFLVTENDQGLVGERLEGPNASTFSKGRLFFERGYTLKVAASYRGPWDLRLGAAARYQDGQHFARFVIPTDLNQGPEPIKAIYNGRSRFSYVLTLDVRVEKAFTVGRARLAGVLDAFNLPGEAVEVEEKVAWGQTYRDTSAVQPPRVFRLGVRVDF